MAPAHTRAPAGPGCPAPGLRSSRGGGDTSRQALPVWRGLAGWPLGWMAAEPCLPAAACLLLPAATVTSAASTSAPRHPAYSSWPRTGGRREVGRHRWRHVGDGNRLAEGVSSDYGAQGHRHASQAGAAVAWDSRGGARQGGVARVEGPGVVQHRQLCKGPAELGVEAGL